MNVLIPEQLTTFIAEQVAATGLNDASEYIAGLIEQEQQRLAQQEKIEALLLEGLGSGESIEATDDWWATKRATLLQRRDIAAE